MNPENTLDVHRFRIIIYLLPAMYFLRVSIYVSILSRLFAKNP